MNDWTAGYVADIAYTFGYYPELNPLRLKLAFLGAGMVFPETGTACELGFGQGLSTNIHAAGSVTSWYGTDFNPSQAGFARDLAQDSGARVQLLDEDFESFLHNPDLPQFDYIGLHGIWSWVSDENRRVIVDFLEKKLKIGGVVYISYNTMPGWATFAPMRHLMTLHADVVGSEGSGIVNRINDAIAYSSELFGLNPGYLQNNPAMKDRLERLKDLNSHYLAHEYFNRDWHPMYFSDMASWMESAKLQFACSANYLDQIDAINLKADQQQFIKKFPDTVLRESTRDFMINQQFRRDYWVKGVRTLDPVERKEHLNALRVMLVTNRQDIELKVSGYLGDAKLNEEIYTKVLDVLDNYQPVSLQQLEEKLAGKGKVFPQLIETMLVLCGVGYVALVQDEEVIVQAREQCDKLNLKLLRKSRASNDIQFLASPVTGGGIQIGRVQQLFILALLQGKKTPAQLASFVWDILKNVGQKLLHENVTLETDKENLQELSRQATEFKEQQLAILKALQIVP